MQTYKIIIIYLLWRRNKKKKDKIGDLWLFD